MMISYFAMNFSCDTTTQIMTTAKSASWITFTGSAAAPLDDDAPALAIAVTMINQTVARNTNDMMTVARVFCLISKPRTNIQSRDAAMTRLATA
jgi:hypothetical protein